MEVNPNIQISTMKYKKNKNFEDIRMNIIGMLNIKNIITSLVELRRTTRLQTGRHCDRKLSAQSQRFQ